MKALSLFSLVILTAGLNAYADRGEDHFKEMCQTDEVKQLVGATGSCNIVTAPSKNVIKGACMGILMKQIPCTAIFDTSAPDTTGMRIVCGDPSKPILDQRVEVISSVYQVTAIIRTDDGQILIKKSPGTNAVIQSGLLELSVNETGGEHSVKMGIMTFLLKDTANPLTDVICQ